MDIYIDSMDSLNIKQSRIILEVEMKVLQGYVENRTKEAALATMLLALVFVSRTFKLPVPGPFFIDFTAAIFYTAASVLSWPYTLIFSLANFYGISNVFGVLAYFIGSQVVFFLSKTLGEKWVPHVVGIGQLVSLPSYGLLMHVSGLLDFRIFILGCGIPALINTLTAYFGGLMFWRVFRGFKIIG